MKRLPAVASFAAVFLAIPLCAIAQAVQQEVAPPPAECIAALSRPFDGGLDPRIEPDCDSTAFYYGIGRDRDYDAAKTQQTYQMEESERARPMFRVSITNREAW